MVGEVHAEERQATASSSLRPSAVVRYHLNMRPTVAKLGPIEISAKEKQTVNFPMWAGIGAIMVGGLLLVLGGKKG